MTLDAATLAVIRAGLEATCEEMGASLQRSAFSPNIKERRDFSCALFDTAGRLASQAEHIPVHLGSMEPSVAAVLRDLDTLRPGDTAVCNDPYRGGTHVPDVTMVNPIHVGSRLLGYAANRAHHADMGGIAPGSMPAGATRVDEEGVIFRPMLLHRRGEPVRATYDELRKTRNVPERVADFRAQRAACAVGASRIAEMVRRRGARTIRLAFDEIIERSRRWLEARLDIFPTRTVSGRDALDDDGFGPGRVPLQATIARRGRRLVVDFEGSSLQRRGNVNAPLAVTQSATYYVVKLLADPAIPSNHGLFQPVEVRAPLGSVLNPRSPAAVSAGNVETSSRVVDLLLGALAPHLRGRVPAMSQGTMNNTTIGGTSKRRPWAYYETIAGGEGATPWRPGMSGVHTHMTNTLNTPVEALEHSYPLRVRSYTIRRGSGGPGRYPGGDGVIRELELLEESVVSLLTERRGQGPRGLQGGGPGRPGRNILKDGQRTTRLPAKTTRALPAGAVLRIETPGGGAWGRRRASTRASQSL